jgi:hypothetical protein
MAFVVSVTISCGHPNQETYTSPPARTESLDSDGAGRPKVTIPPKYLTAEFEVVSDDTCRVKIDLYAASTRLIRNIVDSVYSPGKHSYEWRAVDKYGGDLKYGFYYYQFDICGKISTRKISYRPVWK